MRSLRAVEEVHLLLLLRRRGVHIGALGEDLRILDAGGFAVASHTNTVPGAEL